MSLDAAALTGVWHLTAYTDVDAAGQTSDGPLGDEPRGLLFYSPRGYMSVSMMRTRSAADAENFMGYAGTWRLAGDQVIHEVAVSSHPHLVSTRQVRDAVLADGVLTLRGTSLLHGRRRQRLLTWRRLVVPHPLTEEDI
ncbi:lipocalin-like domain-containing protein [Streptomyces polygonati]|uniref:Lipocalin-like domain-containing protein n=1 Tax=Streptomyces polygonati TaxID=1617087 RepID=A0ABV8HHU3_9ACTN